MTTKKLKWPKWSANSKPQSPKAREASIRNFDNLRTRGAIELLEYLTQKYSHANASAGFVYLENALFNLKKFHEMQFPKSVKRSKIDLSGQYVRPTVNLSGLPELPPGTYDVCQCESMPGEDKWRWKAGSQDGGVSQYECKFCGKEVLV